MGACSGLCSSSTPCPNSRGLGTSAGYDHRGLQRGAGGLARQPRAVVWGPEELWPWPHVSSISALQVLTCPNASFTDLAEIVSRIEPTKVATVDGELDAQDTHLRS